MQNDKTDKKYDKLINSQKNTQAWLEYSPVCTKIVDLDFNLKYMSRAGIEAIGVEDITIFYDKPYPVEIYPQPYRDTWIACFKHAKDTGEIIARDIIAIANDGREIWFDSTFIPVNDDNGVLQYIIVTSENITNRIEAEKQLQELNKNLKQLVKDEVEKNREKDRQIMEQSRLAQMGEMISMIAHQWRQPLAAISSTSAGINLKAKLNKLDNDTAVALSTKINDYSQHLSNTIDDFREFFKSNKEKKEITYNEIVKSVLNIVEVSIKNKDTTLKKELQSDIVFNTYPNELKQVVLNLIKNAEDVLIDNKTENPTITITTKENILTISDNGGGIPEDIMAKIFDPYFSTKTKKDGTGLGLYMSKTIIEEHCGGELSVSNDEDGAVFTIKLDNNKTKG